MHVGCGAEFSIIITEERNGRRGENPVKQACWVSGEFIRSYTQQQQQPQPPRQIALPLPQPPLAPAHITQLSCGGFFATLVSSDGLLL